MVHAHLSWQTEHISSCSWTHKIEVQSFRRTEGARTLLFLVRGSSPVSPKLARISKGVPLAASGVGGEAGTHRERTIPDLCSVPFRVERGLHVLPPINMRLIHATVEAAYGRICPELVNYEMVVFRADVV